MFGMLFAGVASASIHEDASRLIANRLGVAKLNKTIVYKGILADGKNLTPCYLSVKLSGDRTTNGIAVGISGDAIFRNFFGQFILAEEYRELNSETQIESLRPLVVHSKFTTEESAMFLKLRISREIGLSRVEIEMLDAANGAVFRRVACDALEIIPSLEE